MASSAKIPRLDSNLNEDMQRALMQHMSAFFQNIPSKNTLHDKSNVDTAATTSTDLQNAFHSILPCPSDMVQTVIDESNDFTSTTLPTAANIKENTRQPSKARTAQYQQYIQAAADINASLQENTRITQDFYNQFLQLMRQQTESLSQIANVITAKKFQ